MLYSDDRRIQFAVLKGCVEHGQAGAYFGSWLGLEHHVQTVIDAGWIDSDCKPTERGWTVYDQRDLASLPQVPGRRWYLWTWSKKQRGWE